MTSPSYRARTLTSADRVAVDEICAHSFPDGDYVPAVFDAWLADSSAYFYGVLAWDGALAGIGRVRLLDGGATAWCEGDRVALDHRQRGVGRALLKEARRWAHVRGARRLRAAVYSENVPSMRLFAAAGFHVEVRFDRWLAQPLPGGRLPRPLPLDELENALAVVRRSVPYRASKGTYAPGWTVYDLDLDRLGMHMEQQEVVLAGDSIGALAILSNFTPGASNRPTLAFLSGAPIAITRLLRGIRTLAHLRGLSEVRALLPCDAGLDGTLAHAGFVLQSPGQLILQQQDLDRD